MVVGWDAAISPISTYLDYFNTCNSFEQVRADGALPPSRAPRSCAGSDARIAPMAQALDARMYTEDFTLKNPEERHDLQGCANGVRAECRSVTTSTSRRESWHATLCSNADELELYQLVSPVTRERIARQRYSKC